MASLPKDVLIEILSRLPVKSLIRFRRVCKIWYDLLKSLNFISKRVKNYNVNHSHLAVKRNDDQTWYMFLDEMLENNLSYENLNDAVRMDHLKIEGYGAGLFCFFAYQEELQVSFYGTQQQKKKKPSRDVDLVIFRFPRLDLDSII